MRLSLLILALLCFSGMVIGSSIFYSSFLTEYNIESDTISHLNKSTETLSQVETLRTTVGGSSLIETALNVLWTGVFTAVKLSLNALDIFTTLIADVSGYLGLPAWIGDIIFAGITIMFVFAIVSMIMKWRA